MTAVLVGGGPAGLNTPLFTATNGPETVAFDTDGTWIQEVDAGDLSGPPVDADWAHSSESRGITPSPPSLSGRREDVHLIEYASNPPLACERESFADE